MSTTNTNTNPTNNNTQVFFGPMTKHITMLNLLKNINKFINKIKISVEYVNGMKKFINDKNWNYKLKLPIDVDFSNIFNYIAVIDIIYGFKTIHPSNTITIEQTIKILENVNELKCISDCLVLSYYIRRLQSIFGDSYNSLIINSLENKLKRTIIEQDEKSDQNQQNPQKRQKL
jgi:hypothetical protein